MEQLDVISVLFLHMFTVLHTLFFLKYCRWYWYQPPQIPPKLHQILWTWIFLCFHLVKQNETIQSNQVKSNCITYRTCESVWIIVLSQHTFCRAISYFINPYYNVKCIHDYEIRGFFILRETHRSTMLFLAFVEDSEATYTFQERGSWCIHYITIQERGSSDSRRVLNWEAKSKLEMLLAVV